jgi:hypothetical protein
MANPHQASISRISLRTASITLAFAVVLSALQTAQAQTFTVLYSFAGGNDGSRPVASLVRDAAGNLCGATIYGGHEHIFSMPRF